MTGSRGGNRLTVVTMGNRRLSVGVLHPSFEVWGGAEWFAHQTMQALAARGALDLVLYTHRWIGDGGEPDAYRVVEHRVGAYDTGPWDWDLIGRTQARAWARHDVLWVHNYPATEWVAAAHVAGARLPPAVWCCQEPPVALFPPEEAPISNANRPPAPNARNLARWALTYRRRFLWRARSKRRIRRERSRLGLEGWIAELTRRHLAAVQGIRHIQANSCYTAGRVRQLYALEAEVVYPVPRDLDDFAPPAGLLKEPMVLWVGRMVFAKRPLELLDAWVAACGREPRLRELKLVFVGDGPLRSVVEARLSELPQGVRIEVLGSVNRGQLITLYQRALLTVHLGLAEPFGLVAVEAMAAGTAVLAPRSGGIEETVVDGETGWCLADLRGERLVTRLAAIPDCAPALESMGRSALAHVRRSFCFEQTLAAIVRALEGAAVHDRTEKPSARGVRAGST